MVTWIPLSFMTIHALLCIDSFAGWSETPWSVLKSPRAKKKEKKNTFWVTICNKMNRGKSQRLYDPDSPCICMLSDLGIKIIPSAGTGSITHTHGISLASLHHSAGGLPFSRACGTEHAGCTDAVHNFKPRKEISIFWLFLTHSCTHYTHRLPNKLL